LGVYCTVGNSGCIPEGTEEQADLGRKKGEKRWCSTLEGRIRRRKIKVSIGSDGVSLLRVDEVREEKNKIQSVNSTKMEESSHRIFPIFPNIPP